MFDVSDSVSEEDKVTLVEGPDLEPAARVETGTDECVLMSVRHGSQQSMGQWLLTRPCLVWSEPSFFTRDRQTDCSVLSLLGRWNWGVTELSVYSRIKETLSF